jgi:hypothetical protein
MTKTVFSSGVGNAGSSALRWLASHVWIPASSMVVGADSARSIGAWPVAMPMPYSAVTACQYIVPPTFVMKSVIEAFS